MMDENRFKQALAVLATVYSSKELQPELIHIYWQTLGGSNPDHLDQAVKAHIADPEHGQWFPKPAHLIKYIAQYVQADKIRAEIENPKPRLAKLEATPQQKQEIRAMIEGLRK